MWTHFKPHQATNMQKNVFEFSISGEPLKKIGVFRDKHSQYHGVWQIRNDQPTSKPQKNALHVGASTRKTEHPKPSPPRSPVSNHVFFEFYPDNQMSLCSTTCPCISSEPSASKFCPVTPVQNLSSFN